MVLYIPSIWVLVLGSFFCNKSKPPKAMVLYIPSIWVLRRSTRALNNAGPGHGAHYQDDALLVPQPLQHATPSEAT